MTLSTSPRASIVVAAFNAERCILRAVDSVLTQSDPTVEVLVVDDASTDGTAEIVAARARTDRRVRLLRAPVNGGPGVARNIGLGAAQGVWIAILDADDRFCPDRIERLCRLGDATKADMVADNLMLCPAGEPGGMPMFPLDLLERASPLDAPCFVAGNTWGDGRNRRAYGYLKPLIRRSFLEASQVRYDSLRFAEDYIFYLRCLLGGARWMLTPEAMYEYTVARNSATMTHRLDDLVHLIACERRILESPAVRNVPDLKAAMLRHMHSTELALAWMRFAQALKRYDVVTATRQMVGEPKNFLYIMHQGVLTLRRLLRRQMIS